MRKCALLSAGWRRLLLSTRVHDQTGIIDCSSLCPVPDNKRVCSAGVDGVVIKVVGLSLFLASLFFGRRRPSR